MTNWASEYMEHDLNGKVSGAANWDPTAGYLQPPLAHLPKRAIDLTVGLIGLALTLPLQALALIVVWAGGGAPRLITRERYGFRGRNFNLLTWRADGSPLSRRFTASWLARSIRLVHLVSGTMSLIGPRSAEIGQVMTMARSRDFHRFCVKPGLINLDRAARSGLWESGAIQAMEAAYAENWTLTLDLSIVVEATSAWLHTRTEGAPVGETVSE